MKLKRLSLANYRGFEQIDIDFASDVTVIAGENGSGKSGLLNAIATAMTQALPKFTPSLEAPRALTDSDIQYGKRGLSLSLALDTVEANVYVDINRTKLAEPTKAKELEARRNELRFSIRDKIKGSKDEAKIEDEIHSIDELLGTVSEVPTVRFLFSNADNNQEDYLTKAKQYESQPVAVFYSTKRFFSKLPPILPKTKGIEIATAYVGSLSQVEVSLNDFANWYRALTEDGIQQPALAITFLQQLETALATFLPGLGGLTLDTQSPPRFSLNKYGSRFILEQLSDGERGLLAIVFDLTRRLTIANPESSDPIAEGSAIVLIDEIELHLHPKWQRQVIRHLLSVFKNCQFIVTTHSPLVLGEVEARCVRFLEYQDDKIIVTVPTEAYGMDANRILQEFMGAPVRNKQIDTKLKVLFELIDEEKFDEARSKIKELEEPLGVNEPELTRASTLIRFLEGAE